MATSTERVEIEVVATDKTKGVLNSIQHAFGNLISQAITGVINLLQDMGRAIVNVAADSVNLATGFGEQIAILSTAVSDATISLDDLHEVALLIGADTSLIGVSATEAADSMTGLYKAGLDTTDIFGDMNGYMAGTVELSGALRAAIDLQAASELDLVAASDAVAVAMATFGLEADEAVRIANSFVQSADASVASVDDLTQAMVTFGPTAAAYGFSLEETNAALAILSTRGIKGAEAGTALKSMLTNMMRETDKTTEALDAMNVELYDQDGALKPLVAIIGEFETGVVGMTEQQRNFNIQTVAGTYGMKALQTLMGEGVDGWNAMSLATGRASTAQEIAAIRTDTYAGKLEALEGTVETVKIQLGEALIKGLSPFVEEAATYISDHGPQLQMLFEELGDELGQIAVDVLPRLLKALENLDWQEIVDSVSELADAVGWLMDAFGKLGDTIDTISGKGTKLREMTDGLRDLAGAFLDTLNPISNFGRALEGLDTLLPDWLRPGSPTPLELGLQGIRAELGSGSSTQNVNVYGGINMNGVQNGQGFLAELQGLMP